MALAIYFAPTSMSTQQYDECVKRLRKAGAGHPPGRVYHATFGASDRLQVFDVWTSQAAFDKFGRTLMPILQDLGIDGQPVVMPVHNVITRPASRPRAAAAKRVPAKRTTAKKGTARRAKGKKR